MKVTVMAVLASACVMGRRRPREYRRKVDAAPAYAPITNLTLISLMHESLW